MIYLYCLLSGLLMVFLSFWGFFGMSKLDSDPTVGGAYFAMFFLTSPLAFIIGFFIPMLL